MTKIYKKKLDLVDLRSLTSGCVLADPKILNPNFKPKFFNPKIFKPLFLNPNF